MSILRNVLAVLAGIIIGGFVNMPLIQASPSIIPPPPGVDVSNAESLAKAIHLFGPKNFIMPFLAHAVGTFVGAFLACLLAATRRNRLPLLIGAFFLCGGIAASMMIPAPTWFIALDLIAAYLPMAWLAIQLDTRIKPVKTDAPPDEQQPLPNKA